MRILTALQPDVLGVCEIGTEEDVADLQTRLEIRRMSTCRIGSSMKAPTATRRLGF